MAGELTRKAKEIKKLYEKDFFSQKDLKKLLQDLIVADNAEKPQIKTILAEKLNTLGISVSQESCMETFREKVDLAVSSFVWERSVHSEILHTLYHTFLQYAAPEDFLLRLIEAHEPKGNDQKSVFHGQRLRLRLLKMAAVTLHSLPDGNRFPNYGGLHYIQKYLGCTKKELKAAILLKLDDHVFDVLKTATKEQIRRNGSYGLLRVCDNLENGYFDDKTRNDLFFFAVAYQFSAEECIEKLFEEYYINNLLRCISEEKNSGALPDGHGIHWKDYRDIVWLYYINWQDKNNRSSVETLGKISSALSQLKGDQTFHSRQDAPNNTTYYIDLRYNVLFDITEEQFLDFIKENYDCSGIVRQTASAIQNMPFMKTPLTEDCGFTFIHFDTIKDACCIPTDHFQKVTKQEALASVSRTLQKSGCCEPDMEHVQQFCRMLYHAIRYMTRPESENAIPTRTDVLARYHAYYNQKNRGKQKNFSEVWADYTHRLTGLDQYLNDANFIPMSEKNIIDMMCVLSSYYSMQSEDIGGLEI